MLTICEGDGDERKPCPLLYSKPGYVTPDLLYWGGVAFRLSRLKEGGAVYAYPDALRVAEWCALDCLMIAKIEADNQDGETKQEQQVKNAMVARLDAAKKRGRRGN